MEIRTAEKARDLREALANFNAELTEQAPGTYSVRVDLSQAGADIASVLHAVQQYVTSAELGSALIDLDGCTYTMETP